MRFIIIIHLLKRKIIIKDYHMEYYSLDGQIISTNIGISPFDLSIHRSYAVFDYCIFKSGVIIFLEEYLTRFCYSVNAMGIDMPMNKEELEVACYSLIEENKLEEGGLKLIMTGGHSPNAYNFIKPSLLIFCLPIPSYPPEFYKIGLPLISLDYVRQFPEIKSTNYFASLSFRHLLIAAGAEDFIYYHNNTVSESSRSNIFLVKDNVIKTAENDILYGVTRKFALMLAQKEYAIEIGNFKLQEFYDADEVFLSSTTKRIMPVSRIDNYSYTYHDGSICLRLLNAMEILQNNYIESKKIKVL